MDGMAVRSIYNLTPDQRQRLDDVKQAIEGEDLILDVNGLHPLIDMIVGSVECPFDEWRTNDLSSISLYVFNTAPKLKLTADGIAAQFVLRRDVSYGL